MAAEQDAQRHALSAARSLAELGESLERTNAPREVLKAVAEIMDALRGIGEFLGQNGARDTRPARRADLNDAIDSLGGGGR